MAISSLNIGGAEVQFIELLKGIDKSKFDVIVILMYDGSLEYKIHEIPELKIHKLNKKNKYDISSYLKYIRIINNFKPDIIYSFLPDLNIITFICKTISNINTKLFWGIRAGTNSLNNYSFISKIAFILQRKFSKNIDLAIFNSNKSIIDYKNANYKFKKIVCIPNGFDSERFSPNSEIRKTFRNKYELKDSDVVIGINSRLDHIKGYDIFVEAAINIIKKYSNVYFFSIGYGEESIAINCKESLGEFNDKRFYWLGKVENPEKILPGWDLYCSTSRGEGFSNSIAEAMLSGLVIVASDVGDTPLIVSNCGLIFQNENVNMLIDCLEKLIKSNDIKHLSTASRNKIIEHYSIINMVENTQNEFIKILNKK